MNTWFEPQTEIGEDDLIVRRTSGGVGISFAGAEGTLGGEGFRILFDVEIPQRLIVSATFPNTNL